MCHPFQTIAHVPPQGNSDKTFLLAASGSILLSINLTSGAIASQWPSDRPQDLLDSSNGSREDAPIEEPPNKRQRLEKIQEDSNIAKIVTTPDGQHAIIVTAEDKCIRVFSISINGHLQQLSKRCLSKRPSAITLIENGRTIISADKFGDVYSLPLLPTEEEEAIARIAAQQNAKSLKIKASETTVHSKANMKTLEFQRKQAEQDLPMKVKDSMEFAHSFLLGHISMVTDVIAAELPSRVGESTRRTHILTSDRDEHIRISRGPPQSYVIERYCLGHKDYVSKMCLVSEDVLVSGGGDDSLYVWDLPNGSLLGKISIKTPYKRFKSIEDDEVQIAVSGLWLQPARENYQAELLVALEGQPMLLHCPVSTLTTSAELEVMPLNGNLLDLALLDGVVIVSLDNIHNPGSIKDVNSTINFTPRLQAITVTNGGHEKSNRLEDQLAAVNRLLTTGWHEKKLQSLLYSTEILRKRHDWDAEEGGSRDE